MVDSVGDLEEDESSSVGSSDSEEDEPDPRVQEKVGSRNDGISNDYISNSTEIGDFLTLWARCAYVYARACLPLTAMCIYICTQYKQVHRKSLPIE